MSVFTDSELEYLAGQQLGRIATVGPDGQPHVVPTSFRYNAEHDAIDVGGLRMSQTKKLRDVQRTGRASIVIDDVLPPWQPRMIEVRGTAAVIPAGGPAAGPAEVAWVVGLPAQGRGYAKEAASSLVALLQEAGWTVIAHIHPAHLASQRVAQAAGLTPTGEVHDGEVRWVSPPA